MNDFRSFSSPPALTADAMGTADQYTINEFGIPSFTLMESAGRECAEAIRSAYEPDGPVIVLCGKGNNGGDGLVVARQLVQAGWRVHVVLTSARDELRNDPARNLNLLEQIRDERDGNQLTIATLDTLGALAETASRLRPTLYVDALLGTGLTSEVREPIRSLVEWLNDRSTSVVSVDVPTGLHSDTGVVLGEAVEATHTITMAAPKVGLLIGDGPTYAGMVEVVDIGIPEFVLDRVVGQPGCVRQTTDSAVRQWWQPRKRDAYKYSAGVALVVGGSAQFTGAPILASKAAVRNGAGYVRCACPEPIQSTLSPSLPSVPTRPLPTTETGISPDAAALLEEERADAILVGPGLGRGESTQRFIQRLAAHETRPLVIDADGLNALAEADTDWQNDAAENWILTPHEGEFRRLAGDVDLTDRVRVVQTHAERWGVVLVLKGHPSVVAGPSGQTYVSRTGTPALATAGTGDVLAGQCVSLLSQKLSPLEAAAAALHIGGAAAHRYAKTQDPRTMAAPDVIDELPAVVHQRFGHPGS